MILRSFQRKGLCNSGLKAKSTTFVRNITTIRLWSQFVILKMNINMTDITEKTENGELVTNRDQLVVVDNIESLIKVFRGQQVMLDKDLATLYGVETRTLNQAVKRLTSSSCHPKIFVKEFGDFLMPCHQHCLGINLLVQR